MLSSNCYILGDEGEGAVIDPGVGYKEIVQVLEAQKLALKYIILTHAHIDHILHMEELLGACGGRVVIHEEDAPLLGNAMLNGSVLFGLNKIFREADVRVKDGDSLELGGVRLQILHTPGHTPGSICVKVGDSLFSGDTLFKLGVGRTDLGAGDQTRLMNSLKKLMKLNDQLQVYPGHGSATDIGFERNNNINLWF